MSKIALLYLASVLLFPLWGQHPQTTSPVATAPASTVAATPISVNTVHHVDAGQAYYRLYAIVPIIGSGTTSDPKRPMFAPLTLPVTAISTQTVAQVPTAVHSGVIAYQMQLSDDKKTAMVEFVGKSRNDLLNILTTTEPTAKVFERGVASQATIEAAFQQYKKGFTLKSWTPMRPQ